MQIVNPPHSFGIIKIRTLFIQSKASQFANVIGYYRFDYRFFLFQPFLVRNSAIRFNGRLVSLICYGVINFVTAHRGVESFRLLFNTLMKALHSGEAS